MTNNGPRDVSRNASASCWKQKEHQFRPLITWNLRLWSRILKQFTKSFTKPSKKIRMFWCNFNIGGVSETKWFWIYFEVKKLRERNWYWTYSCNFSLYKLFLIWSQKSAKSWSWWIFINTTYEGSNSALFWKNFVV